MQSHKFNDEDRAKSKATLNRKCAENKARFLEVFLSTSYGHIGVACIEAGIHRQTYVHWMQTDPEFAKAIHDAQEYFTDQVEKKLADKIEEGSEKAIFFYLKTKGKDRGWVERQEQVVTVDNSTIELEIK